jgi:hypothetical protein
MARARSNLKADLRQNFIDLGIGDTSKLGNLGQYIDKNTIQQAINNKYSVYGQVQQQEAKANAQNAAALAARGILQSGQSTSSAQDVINQAEQARYNGLREFLRSGQTGLEHMGDIQSQMSQGVMNAQFAAAQRVAQENAAAAALAAAQSAGQFGSAPSAPAAPTIPTDTFTYPGSGIYSVLGGGFLVPGGGGQPAFVAPGSGVPDLSWLNPHV